MSRLPLLALVLLAWGAAPSGLDAQSLLGSGGLGFPVEALDARARSLGSVGVGLFGWHLSAYDPAAAAGIDLPSVSGSIQPVTGEMGRGGEEVEVGGTRFPHFAVAYPFETGVLSVTFAGVLDQEWEARTESQLELAGTSVPVEDVFRSRGGISSLRVGWSRRIGESFAAGLSAGMYAGSLDREFTRSFDQDEIGEDVEPFHARGRWEARGLNGVAGLNWQAGTSVRLGGSLSWGGDLRLRPAEGTEGERRSYALPTELRVGASGRLTPQLGVAVGASYGDWSDTGSDLEEGATTGGVLTLGGGVEWGGVGIFGRDAPLRLGYRTADLPFLFEGEEASERVISGGLGLHLSDREDQSPLARIDLGVERGTREAGAFSERFWRTTLTARLAGG